MLDATGVDGLLIGRAAQGRPWIFREIEHYLRTGEHLPAPQLDEVEHILLQHLAALHAFYGDVMGVRIARKHVGWYLATRPGGKEFRPGSTLWKTHKRSAPTFARFQRASTEPETEDGQGWPHDDDDREFCEWNNARERQRQPETAPEHAERRGPDPSRRVEKRCNTSPIWKARRTSTTWCSPKWRPLLESVMNYVKGNQTKASEMLGLNRGTLRKKLKQYDLL